MSQTERDCRFAGCPAPGNAGAEGPKIAGLDAGLIPLRAFPLHKWYYAQPLWYYHAPATVHRLRSDEHFFEMVDPPLRELCRIVLAAGGCTTPSCSGHFYPRERFERIWSLLEREAAEIRGAGLLVRDSETHEPYLFAQADFTLPWADFSEYFEAVAATQQNGYVGVALPPRETALVERLHENPFGDGVARLIFDEELSGLLQQPLFGVYVSPRTPAELERAWQAVTDYLRATLAVAGSLPVASEPATGEAVPVE